LIYSFIVLATASGFICGFDSEVKKLGSGVKSMLFTLVAVIVFGGAILQSPLIKQGFDEIQKNMSDSFLGKGTAFTVFSYVILFFIMLFVLKILTATIGSFTTVQNGQTDWLNKSLGGALACALAVAAVMVVVLVMSLIPSAVDAINSLKNSPASIFYYKNIFISIIENKL
jgi:hypothetical protein